MKPNNGFYISASILAADFRHLEDDIRAAEAAGVDFIHVDVMDGVFVPNISLGPMIVSTCRQITSLPIDTHLMITRPERYLEAFQKAGANSISIHIEENPIVDQSLLEIQKMGCRAGLVINPETALSAIESHLSIPDYFLVMTVHPGFGGQKFMPEMLPKIAGLRQMLQDAHLEKMIQVDGGINAETALKCYQAGARNFVAGSTIFKDGDGIQQSVHELRGILK